MLWHCKKKRKWPAICSVGKPNTTCWMAQVASSRSKLDLVTPSGVGGTCVPDRHFDRTLQKQHTNADELVSVYRDMPWSAERDGGFSAAGFSVLSLRGCYRQSFGGEGVG